MRAIIGLIVGVADALYLVAAARARLPKAPVHRHLRPERRNPFGEFFPGLGCEPRHPGCECFARRAIKSLPLLRLQLMRLRNRRKPGRVQNLVRVRVANAAHDARIGERALEGTVLQAEGGAETVESALRRKHLEAPWVEFA